MVWIRAASSRWASDHQGGLHDEKPAHRVRVSDFWIDATEVTNRQFRAFIEATIT